MSLKSYLNELKKYQNLNNNLSHSLDQPKGESQMDKVKDKC